MPPIHPPTAGRAPRAAGLLPIALLIALGPALLPSAAQAEVAFFGRIDARIANPGFTISDVGGQIFHTPLDDVTTRSTSSTFGGPSLSVESEVRSMLTGSALSVGAHTTGTSALGVGSLRSASGGGYIDYIDELVLTSPSLPAGTPVTLDFAFHAATFTELVHDAYGDPTASYGTNNGNSVRYQFTGALFSRGADLATLASENWNGDDHFLLQGDDLLVPHIANGLLDPATPELHINVAAEIGGTVDIRFRVLATVGVAVWSSGVGQVDIHQGSSTGAFAVAFGASPNVTDVIIESGLYGGAYPIAGAASFANANMALSSFTPVPLPALGVTFGILAIALLRRGARAT
ncbi:MAG: hypothetical protein RLW62_12765 [Gammaproteobacteria bacterium]